MKISSNALFPRWACLAPFFLLAVLSREAMADNQTTDVSPILTSGLSYSVGLQVADMGSATLPTLQSYAVGSYNGEWIFVAGRTNGLHNFTNDGLLNFPPAFQNQDIWVIDPTTKQTWSRSITTSDLSTTAMNSLSATSTEFVQNGNTLYVAGGYLYASGTFTTYNTLTALDLPGVVDWVKNGSSSLASQVRQTTDSTVQVTGGRMDLVNGKTFLSFGQDFEGPYTPGANGVYTQQVRSFTINDSGGNLSISDVSASTADPSFRRRDMNIVPIVTSGSSGPALVALSGVFTVTGGAWTVPVEISGSGIPTMADPNNPATFKQGMNNYAAPSIVLYSQTRDENNIVVLGGISLQTNVSGTFVTDNEMPFTSQATSIVRNSDGVYSQYYLGDVYPDIIDESTGNPLLFGAGAEFLRNPDLALVDGAIDLDVLTSETMLGWVFGGIAAQQANDGRTAASNELFEVWYTPVPEPSITALLVAAGGAIGVWRFRRQRGMRAPRS